MLIQPTIVQRWLQQAGLRPRLRVVHLQGDGDRAVGVLADAEPADAELADADGDGRG